MINAITAEMLASVFSHYLALDPEAPLKLKAFDGKLIGIEIRGIRRHLYLSIHGSDISVATETEREPDTTISGSPAGLFKLGLHRDSAPLFFSGEVEIRGDTRLGRRFKSLLADMEIDWEEYLSRFVGDIAAHRIVAGFNGLAGWTGTTASNLAEDIGDYLQEESRDVVSAAELDTFNQQVDRLRDDAERLEARIQRLADSNEQ